MSEIIALLALAALTALFNMLSPLVNRSKARAEAKALVLKAESEANERDAGATQKRIEAFDQVVATYTDLMRFTLQLQTQMNNQTEQVREMQIRFDATAHVQRKELAQLQVNVNQEIQARLELERRLAAEQRARDLLSDELQEERQKRQGLQEHLEKLQREMDTERSTREQLEQQLGERDEKIAQLQTELARANARIAQLEGQLNKDASPGEAVSEAIERNEENHV